MKIALGFFGITRSLQYTYESIQKNFFDVLKNNNINFDVFMHTYSLSTYSNKRTNEKVIQISDKYNEEYKLLNPKYIKIDNQDEIKKKLNLLSYRTKKDPWKTNYNSVDNFILACYSKKELTNMIEEHIKEYDYIMFIRPDCLYIDKIDLTFLNLVNNQSIVIPNFHLFGKYKLNDRFAITNKDTYKIYGEVFTKLLKLSKLHMLHSETILGIVFNENKLNINRVKFNFARVRIDGTINKGDKQFL